MHNFSPLTLTLTLTLFQEHLFDVSDLDREPALISKCGNLDVTFEYDAARAKMKVILNDINIQLVFKIKI